MKVTLKRGFLAGLGTGTIFTVLFAVSWYFTLPEDIGGSDHSVSRWWRGENVSATILLAAVVFGSFGLIGFVIGAFRPETVAPKS